MKPEMEIQYQYLKSVVKEVVTDVLTDKGVINNVALTTGEFRIRGTDYDIKISTYYCKVIYLQIMAESADIIHKAKEELFEALVGYSLLKLIGGKRDVWVKKLWDEDTRDIHYMEDSLSFELYKDNIQTIDQTIVNGAVQRFHANKDRVLQLITNGSYHEIEKFVDNL